MPLISKDSFLLSMQLYKTIPGFWRRGIECQVKESFFYSNVLHTYKGAIYVGTQIQSEERQMPMSHIENKYIFDHKWSYKYACRLPSAPGKII